MKWAGVNIVLLGIALLGAALQFLLFPLFVPASAGSITALLAICLVTTPLCWGLMHESIHSKLFASERANNLLGRLIGITLLLDWDVMRFGHLMHHRANRHDLDRPEDVPPGGSRLAAAPGYYFTLLGGGSLKAALGPLAVFLPAKATLRIVERLFGANVDAMRDAALRAFADPERRRRIRVDFVLIIVLVVLSVWLWRAYWPVLAGCVLARFMMLSLLDNAPHYGTPRDSGTRAFNTTLPRPLRWLVLNGNFHGVHHHAPQLSWRELPRNFQGGFDGSWTAMVLRQFRGPVRIP
jgi:fatty acid desaturase